FEVMRWLKSKGVRFLPNGRQVFKIGDTLKFWGGIVLDTLGGGPGLIDSLYTAVSEHDIEVWYGARALDLLRDGRRVTGVRVRRNDTDGDVQAKAVVLASGGFEANSEMRTRYMGPGWDLAKVRGTRFNTGDGVKMALAADAMPWGEWSGGHAVFWDQNAPTFGDLAVGDGFSKLSYPRGVLVNADGKRFVDEGADFRNYTYAKYGREILKQPGATAWQVFDSKVLKLLRDEYRIRQATRVRADTLEELAGLMEGIDAEGFLRTMAEYNGAVSRVAPFGTMAMNGNGTTG